MATSPLILISVLLDSNGPRTKKCFASQEILYPSVVANVIFMLTILYHLHRVTLVLG